MSPPLPEEFLYVEVSSGTSPGSRPKVSVDNEKEASVRAASGLCSQEDSLLGKVARA